MSIKAAIFDLDGTITQPFLDFDIIRKEMGLTEGSGPILEEMLKMQPESRQRAEKILHRYEQDAIKESSLNPGTRETLQQIRCKSIKIGILTRNKRTNAMAIAKKYNLQFDTIIDRQDGPAKPDAFGVLEICKRFDVKPNQAIVIGDYLFDLLAAKAAGAKAVLLKNKKNSDDFTKYADFIIDRIDQVLKIIEDENGN